MSNELLARVKANPHYRELKRRRNSFAWTLTVLMLLVYYGFISLIAFDKSLLAYRVGNGVTTLGIPVGIGVIVFTVILTGIYVRRANTEFDAINQKILREEVSK